MSSNETFKGTVLALSVQCVMVVVAIRWSVWTRYSPQRIRSRSSGERDGIECQTEGTSGAIAVDGVTENTATSNTPTAGGAPPHPLALPLPSSCGGGDDGGDIDPNNNAATTPSPTGGKTARAAFIGSPHASPTLKSSCQIDIHLMALIQRIQHNPLSHIFWKELRAYLLSQREEERRHGLVLQSELPIVCFSEDADLVATQIEVRSLIAREQLRRPRSSARSTPSHGGGGGGGGGVAVTGGAGGSFGGGGGDGVSPNGQHTPNSTIPSFNNTPRTGGSGFRQSYTDVPLLEGSASSVDALHEPAPSAPLDHEENDDQDVNDDVEALYEQFSRKLKQRLRIARSASHISEVLEDLRVRGGSDSEDDDGAVTGSPSRQRTRGPSVGCGEGTAWDSTNRNGAALSPLKTSRSLFRAQQPATTSNSSSGHVAGGMPLPSAQEQQAPIASTAPSPSAAASTANLVDTSSPPAAAAAAAAVVAGGTHATEAIDDPKTDDVVAPHPSSTHQDMATFFLKQLLDLKHRGAFLRIAVDPHHRNFLRELQHFEDQLRKMAERENPQLARGGGGRRGSVVQGQPALGRSRGGFNGGCTDAVVVPVLPVWRAAGKSVPVRPVISGTMPRTSPPKSVAASAVAEGAASSPPTHQKANPSTLAASLKQRKFSLDPTTGTAMRSSAPSMPHQNAAAGGGRFVRSNTFHSIPQPQPAVASINGGRVGQFTRTHSDVAVGASVARKASAQQTRQQRQQQQRQEEPSQQQVDAQLMTRDASVAQQHEVPEDP